MIYVVIWLATSGGFLIGWCSRASMEREGRYGRRRRYRKLILDWRRMRGL